MLVGFVHFFVRFQGEGFDPRLGGINTGAAFGIGCYFTTVRGVERADMDG